MLVLSRRQGERILIGDHTWVTVVMIDRGKIRLGIECPRNVLVWREELLPRWGMEPTAEEQAGGGI